MRTKDKKDETLSIYSPEVLRSVNKYLEQGDLLTISVNANMSYSHVRRIMTGNRNMCLCANLDSTKIVVEAMKILKVRRDDLVNKKESVTKSINEIDRYLLLASNTQENRTESSNS